MSHSASPDASLEAALRRLAGVGRLLVALDFDGVVAPIVTRAEDARPTPETADAVARLAGLPDTLTAFVSGRSLASLVKVASPDPRTLLVGSHGAEVRLGGEEHPVVLDPEQEAALATLHRVLAEVSSQAEGTWVEEKPAGRVLHTREAAPETAAAAVAEARRQLAAHAGVFIKEGKQVLECSVVHATKGEGIAFLRQVAEADAVFFAGDDVTDEDAFRALEAGDVGVKVGEGETAAEFRVTDPAAMAQTVELLARLRADLTARRPQDQA
ncbi:trehalose-phosphatase [Sinomonas halotolerans]|uniref:Trehalose 6-phosphate phosphatase n=1 Tax=Sinomonas halotolerans TaxID=1644133 RepID=A0ABU9WW66_9MICC